MNLFDDDIKITISHCIVNRFYEQLRDLLPKESQLFAQKHDIGEDELGDFRVVSAELQKELVNVLQIFIKMVSRYLLRGVLADIGLKQARLVKLFLIPVHRLLEEDRAVGLVIDHLRDEDHHLGDLLVMEDVLLLHVGVIDVGLAEECSQVLEALL